MKQQFTSIFGSGVCWRNDQRVSSIYFNATPSGVEMFRVYRPKPRYIYRDEPEQVTCSGYILCGAFEIQLEDGTAITINPEPIYEDEEFRTEVVALGHFVWWYEYYPPNTEEFEYIGDQTEIAEVKKFVSFGEEYLVTKSTYALYRHRETGQIVEVPKK